MCDMCDDMCDVCDDMCDVCDDVFRCANSTKLVLTLILTQAYP